MQVRTFPESEVNLVTVAERASEIFVRKAREAKRDTLIPDGPVYSPGDVDNILAAVWEVAGELGQERTAA